MDISGELADVEDSFVRKYYKHFFHCITDRIKFDFEKYGLPMLGLFNRLGSINLETWCLVGGSYDHSSRPGVYSAIQGCEGRGWVCTAVGESIG